MYPAMVSIPWSGSLLRWKAAVVEMSMKPKKVHCVILHVIPHAVSTTHRPQQQPDAAKPKNSTLHAPLTNTQQRKMPDGIYRL